MFFNGWWCVVFNKFQKQFRRILCGFRESVVDTVLFFQSLLITTHTHPTPPHHQTYIYSNDVVGVAVGAFFLATISKAPRADVFFANHVLAFLDIHVVPVRVHIPIVLHTLANRTRKDAHSAVVIHASRVVSTVTFAETGGLGESLGGSLFLGLAVGIRVGTRVDEGRLVNLEARPADSEPTTPALRDSGREVKLTLRRENVVLLLVKIHRDIRNGSLD